MVNIIKSGLFISLLSLSPAAAFSDDHAAKHHPADANQDGILEMAEMKAAQLARFSEMDLDSDGYLTIAELPKEIKMRERRHKAKNAEHGKGVERRKPKLSFDERWSRIEEKMRERGASDDKIAERKVKMENRFEGRKARMSERRSLRKKGSVKRLSFVARLDKDGDERVSEAEFLKPGERRFQRADANGDGQITPDERPKKGERKPAKAD